MELQSLQSKLESVALQKKLMQGELVSASGHPSGASHSSSETGLAAAAIAQQKRKESIALANEKPKRGAKRRQNRNGTANESDEDKDSEEYIEAVRQREYEEYLHSLFQGQQGDQRDASMKASLQKAQAVAAELRAAVASTMRTLGVEAPDENPDAGVDLAGFVVAASRRDGARRSRIQQTEAKTAEEQIAEEQQRQAEVTLESRLRDITAFLHEPSELVSSHVVRSAVRQRQQPLDVTEQMNFVEDRMDSVDNASFLANGDSLMTSTVPDSTLVANVSFSSSFACEPSSFSLRRRSRQKSVAAQPSDDALDELPAASEDAGKATAETPSHVSGESPTRENGPPTAAFFKPVAEAVDEDVDSICKELGLREHAAEWTTWAECESKVQEAKKRILEDVRRTFRVRYSLVCYREIDRLTSAVAELAKEFAGREDARQQEHAHLRKELEKKIAQTDALRKKLSSVSTAVKRKASRAPTEEEPSEMPQSPSLRTFTDQKRVDDTNDVSPFCAALKHATAGTKEFDAYVSSAAPADYSDDTQSAAMAALQSNPLMQKLAVTRHIAEQLEKGTMFQHDSLELHQQKMRFESLKPYSKKASSFKDAVIQTLTDDDLLLEGLSPAPFGPLRTAHEDIQQRDEKMKEALLSVAKNVVVDWSLPSSPGASTASSMRKKSFSSVPPPGSAIVRVVQDSVEELESLRGSLMRRIVDIRCTKPVPSPTSSISTVAEKLFITDRLMCEVFSEANVAVKGILRSFVPQLLEQTQKFCADISLQSREDAAKAAATEQRLLEDLRQLQAKSSETEQRLSAAIGKLTDQVEKQRQQLATAAATVALSQESMSLSVNPTMLNVPQGSLSLSASGHSGGEGAPVAVAAPGGNRLAKALQAAKARLKVEEAARLAAEAETNRLQGVLSTRQHNFESVLAAMLDLLRSASHAAFPDIARTADSLISQVGEEDSISTDALIAFFSTILQNQVSFISTSLIPLYTADSIVSTSGLSELMVALCRHLGIDVPLDIAHRIEEYVVIAEKVATQSRKLKVKSSALTPSADQCWPGSTAVSVPDFTLAEVSQFVKESALCCGSMIRRVREYISSAIRKQEEPLLRAVDELSLAIAGKLTHNTPADAHNEGAARLAGNADETTTAAGAADTNELETSQNEETEPELTTDVEALVELIVTAPRMTKAGQSAHISAAAVKLAATYQKLHDSRLRIRAALQQSADNESARRASMVEAESDVMAIECVSTASETVQLATSEKGVDSTPLVRDGFAQASEPLPEPPCLVDVGVGPDEPDTEGRFEDEATQSDSAPASAPLRRRSSLAPQPSTRSIAVQTLLHGSQVDQLLEEQRAAEEDRLKQTFVSVAVREMQPVAAVIADICESHHMLVTRKKALSSPADADRYQRLLRSVHTLSDSSQAMAAWEDVLQRVDNFLLDMVEIERSDQEVQATLETASVAVSPRAATTADAWVMCVQASDVPSLHSSALPPLSPSRGPPGAKRPVAEGRQPLSPRPFALHLAVAGSPGSPVTPRVTPRRQQDPVDALALAQKKKLEDARQDLAQQSDFHTLLVSCLRLLLRHSRHLSRMTLADPFEQVVPHSPPIPFSRRQFDLQLLHNMQRFFARDGDLSKQRLRFAVLCIIAEQRLLKFIRWRRMAEALAAKVAGDGRLPPRVASYLARAEQRLRLQAVSYFEKRKNAVSEQLFARRAFMSTAIAPVLTGLEQFPNQVQPKKVQKAHGDHHNDIHHHRHHDTPAPSQALACEVSSSPKDLPSSQLDDTEAALTQLHSRAATCSTAQGQRRQSGGALVQTPLAEEHQGHPPHTEEFIGATTFETIDVWRMPGAFSREAGGILPPLARAPAAVARPLPIKAPEHRPPGGDADHLYAPLVAKAEENSEVTVRRSNWKGVVRISNKVDQVRPAPDDSSALQLQVRPSAGRDVEETNEIEGVSPVHCDSRVPSLAHPRPRLVVAPHRTTIMQPERAFVQSFLAGRSVGATQRKVK